MKTKKINIITIHGIRSKGDLLEKTAYDALKGLPDNLYSHGKVTPIDYPRVLAVMHHIPWVRKVIEWGIARRLHEVALLNADWTNVVMAHSNGTRALSRVLETVTKYHDIRSYEDFRISKVLLFGSIIPRNYDWSRFGRSLKVVNFVGTKDKAVLFSKGWSGRYGFKHPFGNVSEYKFPGGHSDYPNMIRQITTEVCDV